MNLLNVNAGRLSRAVCLGLLVAAGGCASTEPKLPTIAKWGTADEYPEETEQPDKIVALWSDDVLHQAGGPPTRGLGGRVYFYNPTESAVPVDGQLVVYGFEDHPDDETTGEEDIPVKKFVFTKDQLVKHYSPSEFGPSYSFWLPWDSDMEEQKWISVVPVFIDSRGKVVMGQHARHRLNGKKDPALAKKEKQQKAKSDEQVQLASHETSEPTSSDEEDLSTPRRLEATSIPLRGVTPAMIDSLRQSMQDSQVRPAGGAAAEAPASNVRPAVGRKARQDEDSDARTGADSGSRANATKENRSDTTSSDGMDQVRNLTAPPPITTARQLTRPRIEPDHSDWRNQLRRSAPTPPSAAPSLAAQLPNQLPSQSTATVPGPLPATGLPTLPGTGPGPAPRGSSLSPADASTEMVAGQAVTSQVYYGSPGSSLGSGLGSLVPAAYPTNSPGAGSPAPTAPSGSLLRLPTR
ncbi:MAG: hypothetical protein U0795_21830 [Pirellulales bacterium]